MRYSPVFVRRLLLLWACQTSRTRSSLSCSLRIHSADPDATQGQMRDLPAPVYVSSVRARGLRPRRGGTTLAMTTCSVLPSVPYDAVGPPNSIFLSRLNTQPTRCPVNASPLPSRTATHDSGPTWFATPWLGGTCTRETYRFVPAHRMVRESLRRAIEQPGIRTFSHRQGYRA